MKKSERVLKVLDNVMKYHQGWDKFHCIKEITYNMFIKSRDHPISLPPLFKDKHLEYFFKVLDGEDEEGNERDTLSNEFLRIGDILNTSGTISWAYDTTTQGYSVHSYRVSFDGEVQLSDGL